MSTNAQSFSICLPAKCDACCPFCVSKMTGDVAAEPVNWSGFLKACEYARICRTPAVLFTGKGEPMVYQDRVRQYLSLMHENGYRFPVVEIQTNGLALHKGFDEDDIGEMYNRLVRWRTLGLTGVSVSVVSADPAENHQIMFGGEEDVPLIDYRLIVKRLKQLGLLTRINLTMMRWGVDTAEKLFNFIESVRSIGFDQVTIRPLAVPRVPFASQDHVAVWAKGRVLGEACLQRVLSNVRSNGTLIRRLMHGAEIYDYRGMNVCLSNCLTHDPEDADHIRQLIWMPDQTLTTEWEYPRASRIL